MERSSQGPRLAELAAQPAQFGRLPEEIDAMAAHHLGEVARVRRDDLDLDRVAIADAVDDVVCLLWQAPGVPPEDADVGGGGHGPVDEDRGLARKAGHAGEPR